MVQSFDICIRGAGIVGRALALHLASMRLRVALVEQASPFSIADVRAYALNLPSRTLLESVGCWPPEPHHTPVHCMKVWADEGGQVAFSATGQQTEALSWIVDVPALENTLADAVRNQARISVVNSPVSAALTVICEGRSSNARHDLGLDFDIIPYPQSALAARVQSDTPHLQTARQWFHNGDILALLPVAGSGGCEYALVWSTPPERAQHLHDCTACAFDAEINAFSGDEAGALSLTSQRRVWPLQHAQARRWSGCNTQGAWVLAGDAAHTVHPLAGQGLNLGLADVAELVRLLDDRPSWRSVADTRLLRQYERRRKANFALMGGVNDTLQQLFTLSNPLAQTIRSWGMNRFDQTLFLKNHIAQRAMGRT